MLMNHTSHKPTSHSYSFPYWTFSCCDTFVLRHFWQETTLSVDTFDKRQLRPWTPMSGDNSKNSSDFYSALSYFRPRKTFENNNYLIHPETFKDFYGNQFTGKESNAQLPLCDKIDESLDKAFTYDELNEVIQNLSTGKAPGTNCIPNEAWKALNMDQRLCLLYCFNKIWKDETTPIKWKEIIISPINKKGDKTDPATLDRSLSLTLTWRSSRL